MAIRPHYAASRREDVEALASDMRDLSEGEKVLGLVAVHACGLMLPLGLLRVAMWLVSWRGERAKARLLGELYHRDRDATLKMWDQTCDHVLLGRDREDADSAGGWSQREIDLFVEVMSKVRAAASAPAPCPSATGRG